MSVNWIDVTKFDFKVLLLLERVQISWFPGWLPEQDLRIALEEHPAVDWYLRNKCPQVQPWLDQVMARELPARTEEEVRAAEINVMNAINDLLAYVVDPKVYDQQPFLGWDSEELRSLTDFTGKLVADVGAGTGRLAFVAAEEEARAVFAVEPVGKLRSYMRHKAEENGVTNLYPIDGTITNLPFPNGLLDVCMGGHVFGDHPEAEHAEMVRVCKLGGMIILCPGNNDTDEGWHSFLVEQGYEWSRFEEPEDGIKRKYWKRIGKREGW